MNNIIVGMGEALWDVLPEGKKILAHSSQVTPNVILFFFLTTQYIR